MNDIKRIFDIRHVYARLLIVVSLSVFAFIGWLSLRQSVRNSENARIDEELNRIEQKLEVKLLAATYHLRQMRSYLHSSLRSGTDQKRFEDFAESLDIYKAFPGLSSIGFAEVVRNSRLKEFVAGARTEFPDFTVHPQTDSDPRILVRMLAPPDQRFIHVLGFDLTSVPPRVRTLEKALEKDDVQFTPPVALLSSTPGVPTTGFVGYLPVYSSARSEKFPLEERRSKISGYAFISFRAREFFEGEFGAPDPDKEKIAFDIVVSEQGTEKVLYRRFDLPQMDQPMRVRKEFSPLLHGWAIHARALPGALGFFDENLHNIFALVAALLIASIWWSLQASASEMRAEESSRKQLVDSERRVKEYSRTLLKLNLSIRNVLSEISHERILPAVAANLRDGLQADLVALYLRQEHEFETDGRVHFTLRQMAGTTQAFELKDKISLQQIWELTNLRDVLYAHHDSEAFRGAQIFIRHGEIQSFIVLPFVDQTESVVGFSLLLSTREFVDDEFIDSYLSGLVKPIGVALRNSHLYTKAQEAAHSKTTFLANMSHEIRTPLGAIVGFSDLLCQENVADEYRTELKQNIHRNTRLLTRIIDDILDFAKFELSQPVLNFKNVHLGSLITEVQSVVHMFAQEKKIALRFEILGGLPEQIETDDIRVKQILLNLIGNAIKFTDNGHVVVEISYDPSSANLHFKVVDTGSGIPTEVRERLFQPFSQGDNTNTRRYGGTGLGLVLSRKLAQALGGNVRLLSSEVGRGSVFELVVPTRANEATEHLHASLSSGMEDGSDLSGALKDNKILLVEDSVDNQEIFTLFLQRAGAKVELAKSGDEALIKAATNEYDIILMDIQLPIVDGKQATRILRRRGWNKPIIALTAHALEDERLAVLQAGCDGQITKPVTGSALVFAVKRYLERGQTQIGS